MQFEYTPYALPFLIAAVVAGGLVVFILAAAQHAGRHGIGVAVPGRVDLDTGLWPGNSRRQSGDQGLLGQISILRHCVRSARLLIFSGSIRAATSG